MLAEKVKHFPVLYDKQVKGYSLSLFRSFWTSRWNSPSSSRFLKIFLTQNIRLVRFKALRRALFFLRLLNKRSNSKSSSKKSAIFIFFKRWYLKFCKLLSYNIPYWIEILVKNELKIISSQWEPSFNELVLIKEQPTTHVTHFRNSNFQRKMKRLQIPQKLMSEKFYAHEIATVDLSKTCFLKNAKKT